MNPILDEPSEAVVPPQTQAALDAIGAWSHLDRTDAIEALGCFGCEQPPTPPIDDP